MRKKQRKTAPPGEDDPEALYWEDGTPATFEDWVAHKEDSRMYLRNLPDKPKRVVGHIFPDMVRIAIYNAGKKSWCLAGLGGFKECDLRVRDVNASDEAIRGAVSCLRPIIFRVNIVRWE